MNRFPAIVTKTFDAIYSWAQQVNTERSRDIVDWNNLPQRFVMGRNRTLLNDRAEPSSSSDVLSTDQLGDIYVGTSNVYILIDNAGTYEWLTVGSGGGGGGAPTNATYVTMSLNGTLTNERVLTAGNNVTITDSGANSTVTIDFNGVTNLDGGRATSTFGAESTIDGGGA